MTTAYNALAGRGKPERPFGWAGAWFGCFVLALGLCWLSVGLRKPCPTMPVPSAYGVAVYSRDGQMISGVLTPHEAADERDKFNHNFYHVNKDWLPAETASVFVARVLK